MRVAVFAARNAPKVVVFSVLDQLNSEFDLSVVSWLENRGGEIANDWGSKRLGSKVFLVSNVKSPGTRKMGRFFDARAAITTCFKLYAPDRCLIFSPSYWVAAGLGRKICQTAERWNVPAIHYEPTRAEHDQEVWKEPYVGRQIELCGKVSPVKKTVCSRLKGHPSAWHWSHAKGERRYKFWQP